MKVDIPTLSYYMSAKGYNKSKLAEKAGLARNTITPLFRGDDVAMSTICNVIRALDIPSNKAGEIFLVKKYSVKIYRRPIHGAYIPECLVSSVF